MKLLRPFEIKASAFLLAAFALFSLTFAVSGEEVGEVGKGRIARWKGDKTAAFLLMFDDSIPSHIKFVVPELQKRGFIGTFYVNPGRGEWQPFRTAWEQELPAAGMVYGNHTMTHQGVSDVANAEEEIGKCNDVILKLFPGKTPRLISFGVPGVAAGKWNITKEELNAILARHHLIPRPSFDGHGAMVAVKTSDEMLALVDKAISNRGVEHIVFHGVGGEWITTPLPMFITLLDGLVAKADQLWITDPISAHQYETERNGAEYRLLEQTPQTIRFTVRTPAPADLYDAPLTAVINVPGSWQKCSSAQGSSNAELAVTKGTVRVDVVPDGSVVTLTALPAAAQPKAP